MRFKTEARKPQPQLVASRDQSRPALTKVHLDVEKAQVTATDSYTLVRFPVEVDPDDTSGPVPVEALKALLKPPNKYAGKPGIHIGGEARVAQFPEQPYLTIPRDPLDYQFLDADRLFPDQLSTFEIGIDAELLYKLAKSFGGDCRVRLRFAAKRDDSGDPDNLRPIVVEPLDKTDDDPDGILMPIRLR